MRAQFEKLRDKTLFSAFQRQAARFPFYWHYHPECELTLILDSQGQRLVGDGIADYGPGDLVLLGSNVPHSWRSQPFPGNRRKMHRAVVVHFREDFLGPRFLEEHEMEQVARLLRGAKHGLAYGPSRTARDVARRLEELPSCPPGRRLVLILSILLDLAEETRVHRVSTSLLRPAFRSQDQRRIEKICHYLAVHYENKIDFAELCDEMRMNHPSLCRFFKRTTGRTMTTYLHELRIGAASALLKETEHSILDIALGVGFDNYSNFCRQFKKIKRCNPRTLRKEFQRMTSATDHPP